MGIKELSAGLICLLGQPALYCGGRVASIVPDQCSGVCVSTFTLIENQRLCGTAMRGISM